MSANVTCISKYYLEEVLGKGKRFPRGSWSGNAKYDNAREVTKTLIEKVLRWNAEEIKEKLSINVFKKNGLYTMIIFLFNNSPYLAIDNAYPGKFKPWELTNTSKLFWNLKTAKEATIWLIEEKLKWSDDEIKEKLSVKTFKENSLGIMLTKMFDNSVYLAIDNAYPGKFKEWSISNVSNPFQYKDISEYYLDDVLNKGRKFPNGTWNCYSVYDNARKVTKTLIEKVLNWTDDDIKKKLLSTTFRKYGLGSMLMNVFFSSPYLVIDNAYPGKFKPWELHSVPKSFWNLETAREATIWLIEEKLKWSDEDIRKKLTMNTFKENSLGGMLNIFNCSTYKTIENAYPGKFKPWELSSVPKSFWNLETARKATIWLIEEKLKWSDEDVKKNLSVNIFRKNSLAGMVGYLFNSSPYLAINNAYPGKYKKNDFKNYL